MQFQLCYCQYYYYVHCDNNEVNLLKSEVESVRASVKRVPITHSRGSSEFIQALSNFLFLLPYLQLSPFHPSLNMYYFIHPSSTLLRSSSPPSTLLKISTASPFPLTSFSDSILPHLSLFHPLLLYVNPLIPLPSS